jgi:opacity protein-like surface antigen
LRSGNLNKECIVNRSILYAGLVLAGSVAAPAYAQAVGQPDNGFYVGIAGGGSHISGGCTPGISCDNNDTAVKVYGGWAFPGELAAELTYYDLGKFDANDSTGATLGSLKGSYWGLGGAWRPQFTGTNWGGVMRVGAARTEGKLDVTGFDSQTRDSWQPYAGLGLTYAFTKNLKVEADVDWTRLGTQFTDPSTNTTTRATNNASTYMVGASFAF